MTVFALATEDELSEAVGMRLLIDAGCNAQPWPLLRKGGSGYLRSKMDSWCEIATRKPIVVLTDLDNTECPVMLIRNWVGARKLPEKLILRVAVREIESWILADHEAFRSLIGKRGVLPPNPDLLVDPKQHLLKLVSKHARRSIRDDLVSQDGAIASQALGYNSRLGDFVARVWHPEKAAMRSESLSRARNRLRDLMIRLQPQS